MFIIRWVVGRIILFFNFIFSPSSLQRSPELQAEINRKTQHLSLYQLPACPFCVKVRRSMKRNGLNIEIRNINKNNEYRAELIKDGGKQMVPCLKISEENKPEKWLYESSEIITYLEKFTQ